MPIVSKIVHHLYEEDVLKEDIILKWHKTTSGVLQEKMKALIEWLEEESEDDSEED